MLKDTTVRSAAPQEKPYKLADSGGLYLLVKSAGKYWRWDYRFGEKRKTLALGVYPSVTLAQARKKRDEARALLDEGIDPGEAKKAKKAAVVVATENSFEVVTEEWLKKQGPGWAQRHLERVTRRFELNVYPWIGSKHVAEISPPDLLAVARRVEERGAVETAHRVLQGIGQVLRYAVATGRADRDVSADLRGALTPMRGRRTHFAAVTDPEQVGPLLRSFDNYKGSLIVSCALRLAPLVFVRPGELRTAKWENIDLEAGEWRYLVTKTQTQHIVPLARQAIEILEELQPFTGRGVYVFPSARSSPSSKEQRPMSDNAILSALRRLGIDKDEMTGHGFRAMARTVLEEVLDFRPDLIEHQLAHNVRDPLGRAYNRTKHLPARKEMMQKWADYLDELKATTK